MRRLRILHVGKYYPPVKGGIETVVETLCRGDSRWAESHALVMSRDRSTTLEVRDGVRVRRVGSVATVGAVSLAPALPFWLARADADVMVLHEPNPMALLAYFLARPSIPLVVYYHSEVIRPRWQYRLLYEPLLEFALRWAARIAVSSPPMLEVSALAPYRAKCAVVPLGLQVERYAVSRAIEERAASLRPGGLAPLLLVVGRLVGYKGVDVLLKSLPGLHADAVIVGDGPQRASLEVLSRELGIADRVRFVGETTNEDLLAWYHACDIFVLPSTTRQETFGMVQLEAMSCGKPVVSTELGTGTSWVNDHERTGLVVSPRDPIALHQALRTLIADPDLRQRFGAAARARVLEHFNAETMCSTTRSLYQDIGLAGASVAREEAASIA
jgi:rhamnosyl/mannosyltransferase